MAGIVDKFSHAGNSFRLGAKGCAVRRQNRHEK
jgi:hypothetical protein